MIWWTQKTTKNSDKNEDNLRNEDKPKNGDDLKYEDDLKIWTIMKTTPNYVTSNIEGSILYYLKKMMMTPHLGSHRTTDPKPEML